MPELYRPGIPTSRQNTSKTAYDNFNMPERTKLGVTIERPSMQALREDVMGPDPEALLAAARATLASTQPTLNRLNAAAAPIRDVESARAEQNARSAQQREYLRTGVNVASVVPGPVGVAGRAASGAMGAYDVAHGDTLEGLMGLALPLADIVPAARAAAAAEARPTLTELAQNLHGPRRQPITNPLALDKQSSIPDVAHYWDALDLGQNPAKAAKIAAGRDRGSLEALKSLQGAGEQARGQVARRAINAPEGADLGVPGGGWAAGQEANPAYAAHRASSVGKTGPTATYIGEQPDMQGGSIPLYNIVGGERHGSTVSAKTLAEMGIPVPEAVDTGATSARQAAIDRMRSAFQEAPAETPAIDLTDELAGLAEPGVSAQEAAIARGAERFGRPFNLEPGAPTSEPQFAGHTLPTSRQAAQTLYTGKTGPLTVGPDQPLMESDLRPLAFENSLAPFISEPQKTARQTIRRARRSKGKQ